jgi:hypothetical protein
MRAETNGMLDYSARAPISAAMRSISAAATTVAGTRPALNKRLDATTGLLHHMARS